jgi:hypothetical protein
MRARSSTLPSPFFVDVLRTMKGRAAASAAAAAMHSAEGELAEGEPRAAMSCSHLLAAKCETTALRDGLSDKDLSRLPDCKHGRALTV